VLDGFVTMKTTRFISLILLIAAAYLLFAWLNNRPQNAGADVPEGKISSVSFAPFREGQSPLTEVYPTTEQIDADIRMLADETRAIRTYASLGGLHRVPELARKYGLKVTQGAWLSYFAMEEENNAEVQQLIKAANQYSDVIERVIVGNEVLLRGEMQPQQLIQYIRQVKQAVKQPVSYADVWSFYLQYPEVAKEVDFITIHILPYWEDEPLSIEDAAAHVVEHVKKIHEAYPGKPILIGESGWPSAGRQRGWAVPSVVNEAKFIRALVQLANEHGFDYNIVEAFNQPWKSKLEGVVGAKWGLYSDQREAVFPLTGEVTENRHWLAQALFAATIFMLAAGFYAKRCVQLPLPRLAAFLSYAQILAALLVFEACNFWLTSFSDVQRLQAVLISGAGAVLGALVVRRALEMLSGQAENAAVAMWLRYLFLAFAALAIYKSLGLGLNGRYLSIPYPLTCIAVGGVIGLAAIGYFSGGRNITQSLAITGLAGGSVPLRARDKVICYSLAAVGLYLIAVETAFTMSEETYLATYPLFMSRAWGGFMSVLTQSYMLGWVLLLTAVLLALPRRVAGYLLGLMTLAVIYGETAAFAAGHDFIDAHPQLGNRLWTAFIYTVSNGQMLLWLGSLLVLSLPFMASKRRT
jgi:exo-beta-1,3-glucanase (GH17 family)